MPAKKKKKKYRPLPAPTESKGGRPTDYDAKYCEMIRDFFDTKAYESIKSESSVEYFKNGKLKKKSVKLKPMPNQLPTLYRFARTIGVHRDTLHEWATATVTIPGPDGTPKEVLKYKEFSDAFRDAKELQKEFLMTLGLAGITPSGAYIFTATNITDMTDKRTLDHEGEVTSNIRVIETPKPYAQDPNGYTAVDAAPRPADLGAEVPGV